MSLNNLIQWCVGIIVAWGAITHINDIQRSILKARAVLLYESRASNWGSPSPFRQGINKPGRAAENIFESLEGAKKRLSKFSDFKEIP